MTRRSLLLVRVFTKSVALVPVRRKIGVKRFPMPDFSRNKDTHCGISFRVAR